MSFISRNILLGIIVYGMQQTIAQECIYQTLYTGDSADHPEMEEADRTWPEAPEVFANWGKKEGMEPPYLRLSGQHDAVRDWVGALQFSALPVTVEGGSLELQIHSTQSGSLSVWLESDQGSSSRYTHALTADRTTALRIPLASLGISFPATIQKIRVQLDQVPAYQYTTVFMDQLALTCSSEKAPPSHADEDPDAIPTAQTWLDSYIFNDLDPVQAYRPTDDSTYIPDYAYRIKTDSAFLFHDSASTTGIVVSAKEYHELQSSFALPPPSPDASRRLWFHNLHILARGRVRDSLFANPQTLFEEADFIAANANHMLIPLLSADLDYESESCLPTGSGATVPVDPACLQIPLIPRRYSHVALPIAGVNGSRVALVYDPEFLTTNRPEALPTIELYISNQWHILQPGESLITDFSAAGIHSITCRLKRGTHVSENTVLVEVR